VLNLQEENGFFIKFIPKRKDTIQKVEKPAHGMFYHEPA
jgi:hypothetical protein